MIRFFSKRVLFSDDLDTKNLLEKIKNLKDKNTVQCSGLTARSESLSTSTDSPKPKISTKPPVPVKPEVPPRPVAEIEKKYITIKLTAHNIPRIKEKQFSLRRGMKFIQDILATFNIDQSVKTSPTLMFCKPHFVVWTPSGHFLHRSHGYGCAHGECSMTEKFEFSGDQKELRLRFYAVETT